MSDLISRDATIKAIDDYTKGKPLYEYPYQVIEVIRNVPSAEKHGKWLRTDVVHIITNLIEGDAPQSLTCSRCGFKHKFADEYGYSCIWHYCPNCGARMVEE